MTNSIETPDVLNELRKISKLLAHLALQDKAQNEKIIFLNNLGFSASEIAEILSMKIDAVRKALQRAKAKGTK